MSDPEETLNAARDAILAKALELAPFEGWTGEALSRAVDEAGFDSAMEHRAFPKGVSDVLDYWSGTGDDAMAAHMESLDQGAMRIREKVTVAVRTRIEFMTPHKAAARGAASYFAHPFHAAEGTAQIARTADAIWRAIGDTSTDFNFYTKRFTLSGVYSSTLLAWFEDQSEGDAETWEFLDRRIENVMQFEKVKARVNDGLAGLPNPLSALATLRYPSRRR